MTTAQVFEHFTHTPHLALSVVDALARALRVGGEFPQPLGDISCEIVEATAPPATHVRSAARVVEFSQSLRILSCWTGPTPTLASRMRRWPLGPGTYRIRVRGDYYQDGEFQLQWPPAADDAADPRFRSRTTPTIVALLPAPAYPLPDVTLGRFQLGPTILRGSAYQPDGSAHRGRSRRR